MEMKLGAKIPDISCKKKENGHDLAVMRHNSVLEQYLLHTVYIDVLPTYKFRNSEKYHLVMLSTTQ